MSKNNVKKTTAEAPEMCRENEAAAKLGLEELCKTRAAERYGEKLPAQVSKRLKCELKLISENEFCRAYLLAYEAANWCRERSIPVYESGSAAASLVAFLLGITSTNPLPRHLYCPRCGYFEKRERPRSAKPENKLVAKNHCPKCGEKLEYDGHDIPFEMFEGHYGEPSSYFFLHVPTEFCAEIEDFISELLSNDDVLRWDKSEFPILRGLVNVEGETFLSVLNKLQYSTGVSEGAISPDDVFNSKAFEDGIFREIPELDEITPEIAENVIIEGLPALVKALGFTYGKGTWNEIAGNTLKERLLAIHDSIDKMKNVVESVLRYNAALSDTVTHREDILRTLMKHGYEREKAFEIMNVAAAANKSGKKRFLTEELFSEMKSKGVADAFIESLRNIEYLSSRASDTELAIQLSKLLWYRVNFPKEFAAAAEEFHLRTPRLG